MTVMALIPARRGSKRFPGKNMAMLSGKPLIQWSIETALVSELFDDIAVSTDDNDITDFLEKTCSDEVRFIERPEELARDSTPMLAVVRHAVKCSPPADTIVLLQPTSPFRSVTDLAQALELFTETRADSVVSIVEPEENFSLTLGHGNRLRPSTTAAVENGAIYIISRTALDAGESWYSGVVYAYRMPRQRSLDINTPIEMMMAEEQGQEACGWILR